MSDTILEHFSTRNRPPITYDEFVVLAKNSFDNLQVYWSESLGVMVQDFREDAPIPAQPIQWETIGQLADANILVYNEKHSWERVKRWYVSDEWLKSISA